MRDSGSPTTSRTPTNAPASHLLPPPGSADDLAPRQEPPRTARSLTWAPRPPGTGELGRTQARHQIREADFNVKRVGGQMVITPKLAPWLSVPASNPAQLRDAFGRGFNELECRAHALWKRQRPDGAGLETDAFADAAVKATDCVPRSAAAVRGWRKDPWRTGGNDREQHPADWTPLADGSWRAPKGRVYGRDTAMARSVVKRRIEAGLPIVPTVGVFELPELAEGIGAAAAAAGCSPHEWLARVVADALAPKPDPAPAPPVLVPPPVVMAPPRKRPNRRAPGPGQLTIDDIPKKARRHLRAVKAA